MRYETKQDLLTFIPVVFGFMFGFTLIILGDLKYGLIVSATAMIFLIGYRIFDMNDSQRHTLNNRSKNG